MLLKPDKIHTIDQQVNWVLKLNVEIDFTKFFYHGLVLGLEVGKWKVVVFVPFKNLVGIEAKISEADELFGLDEAAGFVFPKDLEVLRFILEQDSELYQLFGWKFAAEE